MKNEQLLVGRDAFFDLLRDNRLLILRYRIKMKTKDSRHRFHKYSNLPAILFQFALMGLWVSDITYVETNKGYLYLSLITGAYSRKIISWNVSPKLEAGGAVSALLVATLQLPKENLSA
ncbi:MAG: hypothetical protein EOP45_23615 [Sphingobacteriaceae bacterium]|nr:MAG: hypothetical protein EOP45_23615 [Sphingobacteriaceae bacterium]